MLSLDLSLLCLTYLSRSVHHRLSQVSAIWNTVVGRYYHRWAVQLQTHPRLGQMPLDVRVRYLRWARVESLNQTAPLSEEVPLQLFSAPEDIPLLLNLDYNLTIKGKTVPVPVQEVTYHTAESGQVTYLLLGQDGNCYVYADELDEPLFDLQQTAHQVQGIAFLTNEGEIHLCFPSYLIMDGTNFIQMAVSRDHEAIFVIAISDKQDIWTFAIQEDEVILTQRRLPLHPVRQVKSLPHGIFILLLDDGSLEVTTYHLRSFPSITRLLSETMHREAFADLGQIQLWGPGLAPYSYYLQDEEGQLWELNLISYRAHPTSYYWWNCPVDNYQIVITAPP